MASLNDLVVNWGIENEAIYSYDPAKTALVGASTPEQVAASGGATSWNEGLAYLAIVPTTAYYMLLESGDRLLLESGDGLLL